MNFNDHLILRVQIFARASDGEEKIFVINVELSSAFVFYTVRQSGGQDHSCLCIPSLSRQGWANTQRWMWLMTLLLPEDYQLLLKLKNMNVPSFILGKKNTQGYFASPSSPV